LFASAVQKLYGAVPVIEEVIRKNFVKLQLHLTKILQLQLHKFCNRLQLPQLQITITTLQSSISFRTTQNIKKKTKTNN